MANPMPRTRDVRLCVDIHAYDASVHRRVTVNPRMLVALPALAVVILFPAACGSESQSASTDSVDLAAGEQTYMDFCGSCHGRDFEGSAAGPSQLDALFAPDITTDDDYRVAITDGAPEENYDFTPMPAIASLDEDDIANVTAYVRSVQQERGFND